MTLLGCYRMMTVTIAAAAKHELRWVRAVHEPRGILSDDFQYDAIRTLLSAVPIATQLAGLGNLFDAANPSWDASLILVETLSDPRWSDPCLRADQQWDDLAYWAVPLADHWSDRSAAWCRDRHCRAGVERCAQVHSESHVSDYPNWSRIDEESGRFG
jgi:hypothetical protein